MSNSTRGASGDPQSQGPATSEEEQSAMAELVEVERALASIEGRNVDNAEHLVAIRRDAEKRRAFLERKLAEARENAARKRRLLPYKIGLSVLSVGILAAGAVPLANMLAGEVGLRDQASANVRSAIAPFEGRFSAVRTLVGEPNFTVQAAKGRCYVVVGASSKGAAEVLVERNIGSRKALGSVGFCACEAEEPRVTVTGPAPVAAVILDADVGRIGGSDVLAVSPLRPAAMFVETLDRTCAEAAFDAWAASAPAPETPKIDSLTAEEKTIAAVGLTAVAMSREGVPFAVNPPGTDVCTLAVARGHSPIALRLKGGDRPLKAANGALGYCVKDPAGMSLWREGEGPMLLFRTPRTKVGGLLGLREAAARAGISISVWSPDEEMADDAKAALAASGVTPPLPGIEAKRGSTFALSTGAKSMLTTSDLGADVVCHPELVVGSSQAFCIEARPLAFAPIDKPLGVAAGPAPLWLGLPEKPDREALMRSLDLLAFARRMSFSGYELTSLVGARLSPDGLEVTGRSGEKEIVALVTSSVPPYLHVLSAGGPWTLTDPKPTALPSGASIKLKAFPRFFAGGKREFVIFRL
ncbi:MAG: hypothetical protein IPK82_35655 [Polyangiaceae bacterium]|nr:hypothetical protein [Polyangiaceae bacterium]